MVHTSIALACLRLLVAVLVATLVTLHSSVVSATKHVEVVELIACTNNPVV